MRLSEKRKAQGKCVTCAKPNDRILTHATCTQCTLDRRYDKRGEKRRQAGLCTWCNQPNDRIGTHTGCSECAEKKKLQKATLQAKMREYVFAYKLEKGCADCGYNQHSAALHFDHLPGTVKSDNVAHMLQRSGMKTLQNELAKCEVVCANCHAVRTWNRSHPNEVTS